MPFMKGLGRKSEMFRNIGLNQYEKEKCISCGVIFEQWSDSHLEHCPQCRIAAALEIIVARGYGEQI